MGYPDLEAVRLDHDAERGVAVLTLDRPERMNAWNARMSADLDAALTWADEVDDVRVVVVTGEGRAFCAGADLTSGGDTFSSERAGDADGTESRTPRRLPHHISKPVIAAINGAAVGVGATWPMLCDLRFAAVDAKIGFVFNRRGMLPELAAHAVLPRIVGFSNAADLLLSGRLISGAEAADLGLVSAAVSRHDLLPLALERAHDIAINTAPVSVAISKRLLWSGLADSAETMMAREDRVFGWVGDQPDAVEGVMSFIEKRPPRWSMSARRDFPHDLV
jgi:enoyl-CoA hydratase/carnithine racemase